jgi:GNAT superfamily N-acetyltransferase
MDLRIHPLTFALWPALEDLFNDGSACKRCWCMYWRLGSAYRKNSPDANREAFCQIVQAGPPPGLIAFDGETAVGWCQLTPRNQLAFLDRQRSNSLARVDELPVWCISCFYVRKGRRKTGVTAALIQEAIHVARVQGAAALEAYPLDRAHSTSSTFTGFASTFAKLGFQTVARRDPARPIVRYYF